MKLFDFINREGNYTPADKLSNLIVAVRKKENKTVIRLLENKKNSDSRIAYDAKAIQNDLACLQEYIKETNPSDPELAVAIVAFMYHLPTKSSLDFLHNCGYTKEDTAQFTKTFTTLVTMRTLNDFESTNVKKYKIGTCGSPLCQKHKDKVYLLARAQIGDNAPPFCDNCHCFVRPIFNQSREK